MLSLSVADTIINKALAVGRENNMDPLTIVVLDAGGHIIVLKREDGAGIMRVELAIAKAYGALGMGMSSRAIMDRFQNRSQFQAALCSISEGKFCPVPGGVLILHEGRIVGAVGVTGDSSDRDEFAAILGIQSAPGFTSDPSVPFSAAG